MAQQHMAVNQAGGYIASHNQMPVQHHIPSQYLMTNGAAAVAPASYISAPTSTSDLYAMSTATPFKASIMKFNAGRSFDFEDDVEFCPTLTEEDLLLARYSSSNHSSPVSVSASISPSQAHYASPARLYNGRPESPLVRHAQTPSRPKKILEIVDPNIHSRMN